MSKSDPAGAMATLFGSHAGKQGDDINVAFPAKVVSFDAAKLTASVQPLLKLTAAQPAQISSVPVIGQRVLIGDAETVLRPVLQPGDTVYIVCADAEIKNTLSGQVATPDTGRRHSRMDAVIVGVMPCSL